MSIEKTGVQCDGCKNYESCGSVPFKLKIQAIKKLGWLIKKVGTTWKHYCPNCKTEHQAVRRNSINRFGSEREVGFYWWERD